MAAQLSFLTPDLVNRRYPDLEILVTKEAVTKLLKCVGDTEAPMDEVPDSYFACLREGEFNLFADIGIDLKQLLHVSQQIEYFKKLKVGDKIISRCGISKVNSRKLGGDFVVFLDLYNKFYKNEELVAMSEGTVIVRELKA